MWNTYASKILAQLKQSGYGIHKNTHESEYQLIDKSDNSIALRSPRLGELAKKGAEEFNLSWEKAQ